MPAPDAMPVRTLGRSAMTMSDWIAKLEGFLTIQDRSILQSTGKVSAELAKQYAETEFEKFKTQDDARFESDFDKLVLKLVKPKG